MLEASPLQCAVDCIFFCRKLGYKVLLPLELRTLVLPASIFGMNLACMITTHKRLDVRVCFSCSLQHSMRVRSCTRERLSASRVDAIPCAALKTFSCIIAFVYGFAGPVIGLQSMASSTVLAIVWWG